jgi:hypothetical protein
MSNDTALLSYHQRRATALAAKVKRLKAELKAALRTGHEQGSAATLLAIYKSLAKDFGLAGAHWISGRLSARPGKPAPFNAEIEILVRRDVLRDMRTYDPARAEQVERDFATYLNEVPL